jgi:hypothetical protein
MVTQLMGWITAMGLVRITGLNVERVARPTGARRRENEIP